MLNSKCWKSEFYFSDKLHLLYGGLKSCWLEDLAWGLKGTNTQRRLKARQRWDTENISEFHQIENTNSNEELTDWSNKQTNIKYTKTWVEKKYFNDSKKPNG